MIGALIGVVVLSLVNLVVYLFSGRHGARGLQRQDGEVGWLPIVFSLVCIVRRGADVHPRLRRGREGRSRTGCRQRYAWYCAFGLLVGLIFLYWQILRLLSYLRR